MHWKHVSAAGPRSVGEHVPALVPTLHDIALPPAKRETMMAILARFIQDEEIAAMDDGGRESFSIDRNCLPILILS